MLLPSRGAGDEYGTMLEIQSVQMLPDGRSMVETVGMQRFRLLEKGNLDGYNVGRVEMIDDISPEEEAALEAEAVREAATKLPTPAASGPSSALPTPPLPSPGAQSSSIANATSTAELMAVCHSFIDQLRSGSAPWLLQRLNSTYGTMPTDPGEFSY